MNEVHPLLPGVERYLDRTPRTGAAATEVGPFTLFVSNGPWPYYARPRTGPRPAITPVDIAALRTACATADVPLSIEWVHDLDPSLAAVAAAAGLTVASRPLLALEPAEFVRSSTTDTRILTPDDDLAGARAVADLGFSSAGTAVGTVGPIERDIVAASFSPDVLRHMHHRAAAGLAVTAAAFDSAADRGMVAVGMHQPVGDATEIVGIATLPSERRQGRAAAVTSELVEHALSIGVTCVLLSADSEEVARIYRRLGFRQIGLSCEATTPG